jgi:hypothetical protein
LGNYFESETPLFAFEGPLAQTIFNIDGNRVYTPFVILGMTEPQTDEEEQIFQTLLPKNTNESEYEFNPIFDICGEIYIRSEEFTQRSIISTPSEVAGQIVSIYEKIHLDYEQKVLHLEKMFDLGFKAVQIFERKIKSAKPNKWLSYTDYRLSMIAKEAIPIRLKTPLKRTTFRELLQFTNTESSTTKNILQITFDPILKRIVG